jgi:hypothetical protein
VECQNFGSVGHLQEDLSPQHLKCPPSHSMNVTNLCTNTSCDREMREKNLFNLCTTTLMLCGTLCSQKSRNYCEKYNEFKKMMVNLPTDQTRTTTGLELVVLSRPDSIHNLAIGDNT